MADNSVAAEIRCSDCLQEFGSGEMFAVIKEDTSCVYGEESRMLGAHLFQALVCDDCAEWYGDAVVVRPEGS